MVTKNQKRITKRPKRGARRRPLTIWDKIAALGEQIPANERARFPSDGARNLHHYLHGAPKQDP